MNLLDNLRIGSRLAAAFALVLALILVTTLIAVTQARRLHDQGQHVVTNVLTGVRLVHEISAALDESRRLGWQAVFLDEDAAFSEAVTRDAAARKRIGEAFARYEPLIGDPVERAKVDAARQSLARYFNQTDRLQAASRLKTSDPGQRAQAQTLVAQDVRSAYREAGQALQAWWEFNSADADESLAESQAVYRQSVALQTSLGGVALLAGLVAAVAVTRSITRPLNEARVLGQAVTAGDLSGRAQPRGRNELSELLQTFNLMAARLSEMVSDIRANAEQIATGSQQIAIGNKDLSARTETQAASLEQTASSMDEIAGHVRAGAHNARQAGELASAAAQAVRDGGQRVDDVVHTMGQISASSRRIADIIGVIDGIAFQTNILALNAAVEAARAGEQGRGFAVVATEVRTLAQRSAQAAREIKSLIQASVEQVELGHQQVQRAGGAIAGVVDQVQRVNALIGEIVAAASEQTQGIDQINVAVSHIDHTTQQNAALVEQTAAAAESLQRQSQALQQQMAAFRT